MRFPVICTALIGGAAIIFGHGAIVGATADLAPNDGQPYALIMEYQGQAFALDTGMTLADCYAAQPINDAAKGLWFVCEHDAAGFAQ